MRARRVVAAGLMLWGGSFSLASAAVFNVNTLTDAVDSDISDGICLTVAGECSLRAAIQQANASEGANEIELIDGTYNLSLRGMREDDAATGDLDIKSDITINGSGADLVRIDGLRADRVFQVHPGSNLILNAVTVRNGVVQFDGGGGGVDVNEGHLLVNDCLMTLNYSTSMGGGINNFRGSVELNRSVLNQNSADNTGAGISNQDGNLTINDSTLSDNRGLVVMGGGIYNSAWGRIVEINNSTISGHSVSLDGGAIYHLIGVLQISNSTLSGNIAYRNGGALFFSSGSGSVGSSGELLNVTISANKAYAVDSASSVRRGGGGVYVRGATPLLMANSIIAGNAIGADCYNDGAITSLGHNLDGDGSCELSGDASSISSGVAALGDLADNGGFTMTHALLAASDAFDAGDDARCPSDDQRGYSRPDSNCDIGAYEEEALAPVVSSAPPAVSTLPDAPVNSAPMAIGQLLTVSAGGTVSGVLTGLDAEGDTLTYEVVQQPTLGRVGWDSDVGSSFTYEADADAAGADSFTFRVCDPELCSDPATVNISIVSTPVIGGMSIDLAPGSAGTVGAVSVIAESDLAAAYSDVDYTQPLGVIIFDINDIPTDSNSLENGTVVVIQLPSDAVIDPGAVIRKMDNNNVWRTLGSEPDPLRSTGTIDPVAKRITLVLRDNDEFDANLTVGVIKDPVAVAVKKDTGSDSDEPSPPIQVVETTPTPDNSVTTTTDGATSSASQGGGVLHPAVLMLLGLFGFGWRRLR